MLIDMLLDAQLARAFNHALFLQSFFEFEFLKHTWLARLRVLHPFLHLFAEWIHLASHSQTWQRYAKMPLSMRQILQDSQRMQGSRCDFTTKSLGDHLHLQPGRHSWRTKFIISLTVNILEPSLCHCDTRCHYHATKCLAFPFATWPTISGWSAAPIAKHAKTRQNTPKHVKTATDQEDCCGRRNPAFVTLSFTLSFAFPVAFISFFTLLSFTSSITISLAFLCSFPLKS